MYNKQRLTALIGSLTLTALTLMLFATDNSKKATGDNRAYFTPMDFIAPIPTVTPNTPTATPTPTPSVLDNINVDEAVITGYTLELSYVGTYYITAYCPSECGYNGSNYPVGWQTASGIICHRSPYPKRLT